HDLEITALTMLVDLLPRALNGVFLLIEQVLDEHDEIDLASLIDAIAGPVLRRAQKSKLALPVAEHVRLQPSKLADFADREEFLNRFRVGTHKSRSGRSSRAMSSGTARAASCPSKSIRYTISTIGMSTSSFLASSIAL